VLLTASNGVDLDISFAAFPFEMEVLERASDWVVTPEVSLRTCSAEDLLIYKRITALPIDIHDVQAVHLAWAPHSTSNVSACGANDSRRLWSDRICWIRSKRPSAGPDDPGAVFVGSVRLQPDRGSRNKIDCFGGRGDVGRATT